ncbi:MAG: hypothetical protein ABIA21_03050 [Candidatus Aenigmatarchaeota archaeon]
MKKILIAALLIVVFVVSSMTALAGYTEYTVLANSDASGNTATSAVQSSQSTAPSVDVRYYGSSSNSYAYVGYHSGPYYSYYTPYYNSYAVYGFYRPTYTYGYYGQYIAAQYVTPSYYIGYSQYTPAITSDPAQTHISHDGQIATKIIGCYGCYRG